ncbi:MAG: thiol:disulfide interchange protein DsbA/DsbL [Gammaproteobacteria bacterium]|nr:MAG: thiol:disulfide interchange protein DsbA/DsbL [Gammaproteobacteria bacterium]
MSIRNRALVALWVLATAATGMSAPLHAQGVEGTDYRRIEPPQPTDSPGKIEVIEFCSYMCPHCKEFYPLVSTWAAKLPRNVVFRRVPVGFNRPAWINLARAYYALQVSGDLDKLDGALFHAIHDEHLQLFDEQSLADWVGKNGGHEEQFAAAYASFGVNNQTVQADQLAEKYGIEAVPTLTVNGEYLVMAQTFAEMLLNTDRLIAQAQS